MEAFEDNLEKMNEHKKTVRDSTKATRDVPSYKSTDDKIRAYERESRRNVETEAPVLRRNNDIVIETKPISTPTPSYDKYRSSAELTARCEGSRFGVAGGFVTISLPFPYYFLTGRYTCRIDSKM